MGKSEVSVGSRRVNRGHRCLIEGSIRSHASSVFSSRKRNEQPQILYSLLAAHRFPCGVSSLHHVTTGRPHQRLRLSAIASKSIMVLRRWEAPDTAWTQPEVPIARWTTKRFTTTSTGTSSVVASPGLARFDRHHALPGEATMTAHVAVVKGVEPATSKSGKGVCSAGPMQDGLKIRNCFLRPASSKSCANSRSVKCLAYE